MKLQLWNGIFWQTAPGGPFAYCPDHRMRLDIANEYAGLVSQASAASLPHLGLICPKDGRAFPVPDNSFWTYQRHFLAALEAIDLQNAEIIDVDGYQVPIAKATPPVKDPEFWAEVRINDTRRGKQLVVYAGKRGAHDKAQILIDPQNDKITFDQNNIHPNDVFTKVTAEFDSGKRAILEQ